LQKLDHLVPPVDLVAREDLVAILHGFELGAIARVNNLPIDQFIAARPIAYSQQEASRSSRRHGRNTSFICRNRRAAVRISFAPISTVTPRVIGDQAPETSVNLSRRDLLADVR
jgi:hypothetical protein